MIDNEEHEAIDAILNDDTQPELNPVEEKGEKPEAEEAEAADAKPETEEAATEDATDADKDEPPSSKEAEGQLEALRHERAKRQMLEAQLQQLISMQQANQKPQEDTDQAIDPFQLEPQQFTQMVDQRIGSAVERALLTNRMDTAEAEMIERLGPEKFQEVFNEFKAAQRENPALLESLRRSANPAKYLEGVVEQRRLASEMGSDPAGYRARLRDELKAELLAELKGETVATAKAADQAKKLAAIPKTIAGQGTAAPASGELPDDSIASLLGET